MFAVEILHTFAPDEDRLAKAKVAVGPEHLSAAERIDVEKIMVALVTEGNRAGSLSLQHVGPVGDTLDLLSTIGSAGEALCQFTLNRALMNPHELAAAKAGIAECWLAVSDTLAMFDFNDTTMAAHVKNFDTANLFLSWAIDRFVPLFSDLEAHAQKKFPHLAANTN